MSNEKMPYDPNEVKKLISNGLLNVTQLTTNFVQLKFLLANKIWSKTNSTLFAFAIISIFSQLYLNIMVTILIKGIERDNKKRKDANNKMPSVSNESKTNRKKPNQSLCCFKSNNSENEFEELEERNPKYRCLSYQVSVGSLIVSTINIFLNVFLYGLNNLGTD